MKDYNKTLEKSWEDYEQSVNTIAVMAFADVVKPWLRKYHLTFLAGNGTYYIEYTDATPKWFIRKYAMSNYHGRMIDSDKLPARIRKILDMEIEGMMANSLGTIMPDLEE